MQHKMISVLFLIEFEFLVPFVIFFLPFKGLHSWSTNHYYHQYRYQSLPFTRQNYNEYITFSSTNLSRNKIQDPGKSTHLQLSTIDESTTDDMIQIVHQPESRFLSSKGESIGRYGAVQYPNFHGVILILKFVTSSKVK